MAHAVLVAIMGPTGSGKSWVAEHIADEFGLRLINADAFQVYRGLDIGTNKSSRKSEYAMVDVCGPTEQFGLGEWVSRVSSELDTCWGAQQGAVVVGGTGLYVRALFEEFAELHAEPNPSLRESLMAEEAEHGTQHMVQMLIARDPETRVNVSNPLRVRRALERLIQPRPLPPHRLPPFTKMKFALWPDPVALNSHLDSRVVKLWGQGWREEVQKLMELGVGKDAPAMRAIGYQDIFDHLQGELVEGEVLARVAESTRRYAKRQRTWLRSEPGLVRVEFSEVSRPNLDDAVLTVRTEINSLETNQSNG